uniref:Uncharacterized protein n=1 Tax=Arundo donax TaxID=35708 RepID=A0A0A9FDT2_ARUDO
MSSFLLQCASHLIYVMFDQSCEYPGSLITFGNMKLSEMNNWKQQFVLPKYMFACQDWYFNALSELCGIWILWSNRKFATKG